MCGTCGCGEEPKISYHFPGKTPTHSHSHEHDGHVHEHEHKHMHEHSHDHPHAHDHIHSRLIPLEKNILSKNDLLAERNRGLFEGLDVIALNLVSSPGSGKTSLLERTIREKNSALRITVIEGDQQTTNDAMRIEAAGAKALQINTGTGCHLDASMVYTAAKELNIPKDSMLFIENVGNLVCPALFDLGETKRVVIISVTEGDDKPAKYPTMFESADLCVINKTDLLPYVDFSFEKAISSAKQINKNLTFIALSTKTGEGMEEWYNWLLALQS